MKPLGESNHITCSTTTSKEEKGKTKRPALELLNILNSKIVQENHVSQYKSDMDRLKQENM